MVTISQVELSEVQKVSFRRCPECGSLDLITDRDYGEVFCGTCGLVLREVMLDQSPEWRAFTREEGEEKKRVGPPSSILQYDKGLSTTFQPYRDTSGKLLSLEQRLKMMRLHRWHTRASRHTSILRNLSQAMSELRMLSDKLHIPRDVEEQAALIYRKTLDKGLVRGRSIQSIVAAALYAACRVTKTPRSLKEVVKVSTRSRKEISRCYRLIHKEISLNITVDRPTKYIPKIASRTGLSQKTQNLAIHLLEKAREKKAIVGKGPVGMAAAALYLAHIMNTEEKRVTQQQLAKAAGVTEVTVRNRYKGLAKSLKLKDLAPL